MLPARPLYNREALNSEANSPASLVATIVSKQFEWFITSLVRELENSPLLDVNLLLPLLERNVSRVLVDPSIHFGRDCWIVAEITTFPERRSNKHRTSGR